MSCIVRICILAIIVVCTFHTTSAQVQPIVYIGPYGSVMQSIHNTEFRDLPGFATCCTENRSGTGFGYDFGFALSIPFNSFGFRLMGGINSPSATIFVDEKIGNSFVRNNQFPFDTISRDILVRHSIDATITQLSLRPTLTYRLPFGGDLYAGLGLAYTVKNEFSQRETLISPDNVAFTDGKGIRNDTSGIIPDVLPLQSALIAGYSHSFPISRTSLIVPFFEYHLPLQSFTKYQWNIQKLQFGLALQFGILPKIAPTLMIDTVYQRDTTYTTSTTIAMDAIEMTQRSISRKTGSIHNDMQIDTVSIRESYVVTKKTDAILQGGISAFGIDDQGKIVDRPIVRIEEWEQLESFPLLPYLFFDEASSDLGGTEQQLLLPSQVNNFDEDSLPSSTMDIYRNALNIVGNRLQSSNARLSISGHVNVSQQENSVELARLRAESVQSYLSSVWKISPERIKVEAGLLPITPSNNRTKEGQEENSRVELRSSDMNVLSPLKKRTVKQTMNPPILAIKPTIDTNAQINDWSILIRDSGKLVYQSKGLKSLPDSIIKWTISPSEEMNNIPFDIELLVTDTLGKTHTWKTSISTERITLRKKQELRINDTLIERFALILFDFNKASLSPANQIIATDIRASIKPQSTVIIRGYTDLIGDSTYNYTLSELRCNEVRKFLGLMPENSTIIPLGGKEAPFEGQTPQERAYSRTVMVEIRTPTGVRDK